MREGEYMLSTSYAKHVRELGRPTPPSRSPGLPDPRSPGLADTRSQAGDAHAAADLRLIRFDAHEKLK